MIKHVTDYLDALEALNVKYNLRPVLDPKGDAFMLVNNEDTSRVVVWLNQEELALRDGVADVNWVELELITSGDK